MTRYLTILLFVSTLFGRSIDVTQRFSISAHNVSADKKANDKKANVKDYYPLEIGNKWIYTLETYGEKRADNVFIVTGREKINGVECIKVEQSEEIDGQLKSLSIACYTKNEKGVYLHREGEIKKATKEIEWRKVYDPPLQILSYPLKKLKTWRWKGKTGANLGFKDQTFTFKVIEEDEVETPAGKFKTYVVQRELDMAFPFWEIYYYSADVGLVAHQILNRSVFTLKRFSKPEASKREDKK